MQQPPSLFNVLFLEALISLYLSLSLGYFF